MWDYYAHKLMLYQMTLLLKVGDDGGKNVVQMYGRLASMASGALLERELKQDESKFWEESYHQASVWSPCADRKESISVGQENFKATPVIYWLAQMGV